MSKDRSDEIARALYASFERSMSDAEDRVLRSSRYAKILKKRDRQKPQQTKAKKKVNSR